MAMRSLLATMLVCLLVGGPALGAEEAKEGKEGKSGHKLWTESYDEAIEQAKASGKAVMADFTGSDWCPPCKLLEKQIFKSKAFQAWAKENVVLLYLDFPSRKKQSAATKAQNAKLKGEFKIRGYPTLVFFTHDRKELGRFVGYRPQKVSDWIKRVEAEVKLPKPKKAEGDKPAESEGSAKEEGSGDAKKDQG